MLYLTTLKGITRDGSLETIAEVAHPGAGGDASEVCNRYQDVISSTPEGDALRARYAQVLFILDNQVRSQLEFPPPSPSLEVTAESTGSGEGDLSGEGGAGDTMTKEEARQRLEGMTPEEIIAATSASGIVFKEGATKEEMITLLLDGPEELPHPDKGASAEGGDSNGGAPPAGAEGDLLGGAGSGAAPTPGSMSPAKKKPGK